MRKRALFLALLALAPGLTWSQVPSGSEFRVNSYTTGSQRSSHVAFASAGRFVVVWMSAQENPAAGYGVFARSYDATGAPAGPEFRVNSYTSNSNSFPSVASGADGGLVVAWQSDPADGSGSGVFARRYDALGAPQGGEFQVNSYTAGEQLDTAVASSPNGLFVIAWTGNGQDGSGAGVFGQRYAVGGNPTGAEFRVNSFTSGAQQAPSLAVAADGRFVIVWESREQDGSHYGVFGQRYDAAGNRAGNEFRVNSITTNVQRRPAVVSAPDGRFVVVWDSNQDVGFGIFGQRYDADGNPAGSEFRIDSNGAGNQAFASVASSAQGGFVVLWHGRGDGSYDGIFSRVYDAAGNAIGPELRVNSHTAYNQQFPAVATDGFGRFTVVWASEGQDGSSYGVFGQRLLDHMIFADGFEQGG
jgi:hypothetical protein